jgi:acetyl-CoA carboxylase beta subunit
MRFSELSPEQRIAALLDGSVMQPRSAGAMLTASGVLRGRRVYAAATDPAIARGAIGVAEADALTALLRSAREHTAPVLLVLDSAGARVDEGLSALGAFRRLFREALQAKFAEIPLLALLGPLCFGGASLLACLCDRRVYLPQTRMATSGPTVIEGVVGKDRLDAGDRNAVRALMGAEARARLHPEDTIADDAPTAVREAAARGIEGERPALVVVAQHARLRERLVDGGMLGEPPVQRTDSAPLASVLPPGYVPMTAGSTFFAQPQARSGKAVFLGAMGAPLSAAACWRLADWVLGLGDTHPGSPLVLILDAEAHAATVEDERVLLSDYLVHFSLCVAAAAKVLPRSVLWLPGAASGASYVAFAAPVDHVSALPSARIAILPPAAVRQILGDQAAASASSQDWIETGVADALLDSRLLRAVDNGRSDAGKEKPGSEEP